MLVIGVEIEFFHLDEVLLSVLINGGQKPLILKEIEKKKLCFEVVVVTQSYNL